MNEEDLKRIDRLLARRDPFKVPATLESINGWGALAEEVPGLLAEVRRLQSANEKLEWKLGECEPFARDREVQKTEKEQLKKRCEELTANVGDLRGAVEAHKEDRAHDREELRKLRVENEKWEEMLRGIADRLYEAGKNLRDQGEGMTGQGLMEIATELHRRCQIVKGETPLPAAGARINDPECTCTIDGTPYCRARGTGFCLAENPERIR